MTWNVLFRFKILCLYLSGQQIIESEDNAQPTLGTDSNMECLNESIKSALENQGNKF